LSQIPARLACFAIVSAVEEDLRSEILAKGLGHEIKLPSEVRAKAVERYRSVVPGDEITSDVVLLDYCDFADLAKIIRALHNSVTDDRRELDIARRIEEASPARNRVCHARPLEPDDLTVLLTLADEMLSNGDYPRVKTTKARLANEPTFVFGLEIPDYWNPKDNHILENLPLPEFDDTGFLGRRKDRKDVGRHLLSAHPVVTIVGEGGVGKTALALRSLYDLLEIEDQPFDAVVWVTLKASTLTPAGTREIHNSITSVLGLLQSAAGELGVPRNQVQEMPQEDLIVEIVKYMSSFRVLLAIDNLETVDPGPLRELLIQIPPGSKILITSRVGLGEFELRYPLDKLQPAEALSLMRRFAQAVNAQGFFGSQPELLLERYTQQLFGNPLLIRWFVSSVAAGADPSQMMFGAKRSFDEAITFCFENLFERLSSDSQRLLHVLAAARRPLSRAQMIMITGTDSRAVDASLTVLHNSSMVRRLPHAESQQYSLTDIAEKFVTRLAPPTQEVMHQVTRSLRELRELAQDDAVTRARYEYDWTIVEYDRANPDHAIAAAFLKKAIREKKRGTYQQAEDFVTKAKELAPGFSEVWRVEAILLSARRQIFQAEKAFEEAIQLAPNSARLRYAFGHFLLDMDVDLDRALVEVNRAIELSGEDPTFLTAKALCLTRLGRYSEATTIYEALLLSLGTRRRQWRVVTRDQAIECYRRWMEGDRQMRDWPALIEHFRRANQIYKEALDKGDFDEKTTTKAYRAFDEIARAAISSREPEVARVLWQEVAIHSDAFVIGLLEEVGSVRRVAQEFSAEWRGPFSNRGVPVAALEELSWEGSPNLGIVQKLSDQFGFLLGDDGRRLFFSMLSVAPRSAKENLRVGGRVRFAIGENEEGPCAVSVRLVD
jgi:LuxR family transcriptional regulator, glucitol operon activator